MEKEVVKGLKGEGYEMGVYGEVKVEGKWDVEVREEKVRDF